MNSTRPPIKKFIQASFNNWGNNWGNDLGNLLRYVLRPLPLAAFALVLILASPSFAGSSRLTELLMSQAGRYYFLEAVEGKELAIKLLGRELEHTGEMPLLIAELKKRPTIAEKLEADLAKLPGGAFEFTLHESDDSFLRYQFLKKPLASRNDFLSDLTTSSVLVPIEFSSPGLFPAFQKTFNQPEVLARLANFKISKVIAAPGHRALRNPRQVKALTQYIRESGGGNFTHDPILINLVTGPDGSLKSVDLWNAHHRLVEYLDAGYHSLKEIPAHNIKILVNGRTAEGESWTHYLPSAGLDLDSIRNTLPVEAGGEIRVGTLSVTGALSNFNLGSRNTIGKLATNTAATKPKVGVYFGTFDPIHEGHIAVAKQAIIEAGLDELVIIPNFSAPHKPGASSAEDRIAMLAKRLEREPKINLYTGDSSLLMNTYGREPLLERIRQTYGTNRLIRVMGDDSFVSSIAGGDVLPSTDLEYLVFARKAEQVNHIFVPEPLRPFVKISITKDAKGLSSTKIREALRRSETPSTDEIDDGVLAYILQSGLYK